MNLTRSLYFIATILEVAKSSAEADDVSLLARTPFESTNVLRGSGSNDEKESRKKDASIIESTNRILEVSKKRLLQLITINGGCPDDDDHVDPYDDDDGDLSSMYPSFTPIYEEKKLVASDGSNYDFFGASCSVSNELTIIAAPHHKSFEGAAYLFHLDGTEVAKLSPDEEGNDYFGWSVSMDEKVVVGSLSGDYFSVFSRNGMLERTIRCDDCTYFGRDVATHGNLIVTRGTQNSIEKLFIYSTEGELLKTLEQGSDWIFDVAMSEQFIVSTSKSWTGDKTIVYSNSSPDFHKVAEIEQGGYEVAISNDRIVIGDDYTNYYDGAAYLYKTDGTLITALDRQDASSGSWFGSDVAITDDKVIVGARYADDSGNNSGSAFIYSAVTGDFIKKVVAPDGKEDDWFGTSVCASGSYFVVGADGYSEAAYLFQLP